ncbi:MAG: ImuA family protein [Sphingomonadaceae bacterium]
MKPNLTLAQLRQQLVAHCAPARHAAARAALGAPSLDARLGGGLVLAALHEVFSGDEGDESAAAAFALMLAMRGCVVGKPIMWVREDRTERRCGRLYGPGLVELGLDPDHFFLVNAPDELSVLRAGADIVKCGAVGAVVIEPFGKARTLDLTATRRLSLAAAQSGVMALLLRVGAEPSASAAQTRWQVRAGPSRALEGNAPGITALRLSLLRHRAGLPAFDMDVEWDRDQQTFTEPSLSRAVPAAPAFGADQARRAA